MQLVDLSSSHNFSSVMDYTWNSKLNNSFCPLVALNQERCYSSAYETRRVPKIVNPFGTCRQM